MSFTGTTNSITALENKPTPISTDELLKMMEVVAEDVFEHNHVEPSISNLRPNDRKKVLLSSLRLLNTLIAVCEDNQEGIAELSSLIQRKLNTARKEAEGWQQELSAMSTQIAAAQQEESQLQAQFDRLNAQRGHLLTIRQQCDDIRAKIQVLSDARLDQLAQEKQKLDAEFSRRHSIAAQCKEALREVRENLTRQQETLDELNAQINAKSADLTSCQSDLTAAMEEKDRLTTQIESVTQQHKALQEWLEGFPAWSEKLRKELQELQGRSTLLLNIWNSGWSDQFLSAGLEKLPADSRGRILERFSTPFGGFRSLSELEDWFRSICQCVRELMGQCEERLQVLVDESRKLSQPAPNSNGGI